MRKELRKLLLPTNNRAYMGNMGRDNIGNPWPTLRLRDVAVPISSQGFDAGGVYWGIGRELRCTFQLCDGLVVYRRFYRKGE
jgi:hypothetical protein